MIEFATYISERKAKKNIVDLYLSHLEELPLVTRQHFTVRAEIAGMCDLSTLESVLTEYSGTVNQYIVQLCSGEYKKIAKDLVSAYKSSPSPRKKAIGEYFSEVSGDTNVCKILAVYQTVESIDIFIRTGNIDLIDIEGFQKCYEESIDGIEEFMLSNDFFDKHFSKAIVTYTNLWWYLRNYSESRALNPTGRRPNKRILDNIRKWLVDAYTDNEGDLESVVYGITHTIIGATRFYTGPLQVGYDCEIGILADFIRKHYYTEDLNLETALCLKLSGMPEYQYLVRNAVRAAKRDKVDGVSIVCNVPLRGDTVKDLTRNEHTNSLYIMCCS
jgi:hypothetical protein